MLFPFVDEDEEAEDGDYPDETTNAVSIGVVKDLPGNSQILISLAEMKTMQAMPGGMSLTNWLRIRGLLNEPFKES